MMDDGDDDDDDGSIRDGLLHVLGTSVFSCLLSLISYLPQTPPSLSYLSPVLIFIFFGDTLFGPFVITCYFHSIVVL